MQHRIHRQSGSAAMIVSVGVIVVVALTVGAATFWIVSHRKPAAGPAAIAPPLSPYDPLVAGNSNNSLKSNVLNIASGIKQEELHLTGIDNAINDQPTTITDQ